MKRTMYMARRGLTIGLLLAASATACRSKGTTGTSDGRDHDATATVAVSAIPKETRPRLPPDPPPRIPEKASEAPALEAELLADKAYAAIWDDKHRDERNLLLTAISESLVSEVRGSENVSIPESVSKALQQKKLMNAVLKLVAYFPRMGRFPDDFTTKAKVYLASISGEPRHGLWTPAKTGTTPTDFAALAYWLSPEDASLLREFIAAKAEGGIRWQNAKDPARPYFVREKAALERLGLLTTLAPGEQARLAKLKASPLGDEPAEEIELSTLLKEYGSNEVRADDAYKNHVVEFGGIAGALERGTIGGITLPVGTGKAFEHPVAHCFFDQSETEKVKALNKGDRVRVRGKIAGLMMNVIIKSCELVE